MVAFFIVLYALGVILAFYILAYAKTGRESDYEDKTMKEMIKKAGLSLVWPALLIIAGFFWFCMATSEGSKVALWRFLALVSMIVMILMFVF